MIYITLGSILLSLLYGRIFLQKNKLAWLFYIGSAIVLLCINSIRESLLGELDQYGPTKNVILLLVALLFITVQFLSRKPGLRFFNAFLAFVIIKLAPFLSPELQIPAVPITILRLNLLSSHFILLDMSYKILFIGSLLICLLLLLLRNQSYWDVPRYSWDYLSEEEKKDMLEKYSLYMIKRDFAAANLKIRELSRRIINDIDEVSYRLVGFGHFLLTFANLVGWVWANDNLEVPWSLYLHGKEFFSLVTWLIFAIYLYVRLISDGTKLQTSWIGFIGFIVVCISFLIS